MEMDPKLLEAMKIAEANEERLMAALAAGFQVRRSLDRLQKVLQEVKNSGAYQCGMLSPGQSQRPLWN